MTERIRQDLQSTMRITFADPTLTITLSTTSEDIDGWDSLGHARLLIALEKRFGMRFPDERVFDLNSVAELAEIIEASRLGSGEGA